MDLKSTMPLAWATGLVFAIPVSALANNGLQFPSYSTQALGAGGAGAAFPTDSQAATVNPAGMSELGTRFDINLLVLSAKIESTVGGIGGYEANPLSPAPLPSFSRVLNDKVTIGVSTYGFGIGVDYGKPVLGATTNTEALLTQFVIAPTIAYKINDRHSVGFSLLLAGQQLELRGFEGFGLANPGSATSFGVGFSIGWLGKINDRLSLGASYFSHIEMGHLDGYEGHLADQSDVDIPQSVVLGMAFKATPDLTVTADYLWINWSDMTALGNPYPGDGVLGSPDGPGAGWKDQNVLRAGLTYDVNDKWTVRAGGSYSSELFDSDQNALNFISPVTMRAHVSLGATYNMTERGSFSFAWNRALQRSQDGTGLSTGTDLSAHIDTFGFAYGLTF